MTNNRDLLKEAIADAKAVKETAIANAKAALEEAFTPYLKEKLAAKLSEMDEEEVKESYDMEEGKEEMEEMKEKDMKENFDMDESEEMDEMYDEHPMSTKDALEKTEMDEMDLDELLRELDEMEEGEKEEMMEGEDLINDPKTTPTAHGNIAEEEEEYKDEDADGVEDSEDAEIDLENMSEDDLKSFIEGVIADMVAAGELEGEMEGGEGEEMEAEEEEEISIDELMSGLDEKKKYGGNKGDVPAAKRGDKKDTAEEEGVEDYKKKLKEMEAKLEEAYAAIETVKTDLNEVNLLNAKLLYTNKIFRAKNLTESQKVKVLAAFDKAATTKEAKLVFETLSEGLNEKKTSVNESMIGGASKVAGIAPTKKPILEINNQFARWQTLAGLKK
jgi:Arc/MetJ family transcription regulator